MDLMAIKAKIAAGLLPQTNSVAVRHARYVSGVCVGCDAAFGASEVGVEFFVSGRGRHLLHADCYVMWTEACADTLAGSAVCKVCGKLIKGGTPQYRLGGGLASVHVECRDTIKPRWPRPGSQSNGASSRPAA
jgi:hypothetical protein